MDTTHTISLDAAVAITGLSKSTLWRRVADGTVGRGGTDARNRTVLKLDDVLRLVAVPLSPDDVAVLLRADAGEADAQADMGALFYLAGAGKAALYWLNEAAEQGNTEAMHWLGIAYAHGSEGDAVPQDENLAIMWMAKAAAAGHPLAREQMQRLRRAWQ